MPTWYPRSFIATVSNAANSPSRMTARFGFDPLEDKERIHQADNDDDDHQGRCAERKKRNAPTSTPFTVPRQSECLENDFMTGVAACHFLLTLVAGDFREWGAFRPERTANAKIAVPAMSAISASSPLLGRFTGSIYPRGSARKRKNGHGAVPTGVEDGSRFPLTRTLLTPDGNSSFQRASMLRSSRPLM